VGEASSQQTSAALRAPFFISVRFGEQVRHAAGNKTLPTMPEALVIVLAEKEGFEPPIQ
jgi:hypothetical protein